jgi:hypothetical protein
LEIALPEIRKQPADPVILTNGFSCREQVKHMTGRTAMHLAQVLAMGLPRGDAAIGSSEQSKTVAASTVENVFWVKEEETVSRQRKRIRGALAPVLTPFDQDREPDFPAFLAHCRWLLDNGVDLAIFGTNSEAASLTTEERIALTDGLLDSGIPADRLMPGTGACSVKDAIP